MNTRVNEDIVYVLDKIVFWVKMFSCCFLLKMIMVIESMTSELGHAFFVLGR